MAEAYEVERILLNLVLNARDAMRDGGTLTVETMVMRPGSSTTPGSGAAEAVNVVRFRVSDTGHGMTPEVTARITESFLTTRKMGTRLGLSSVARTVRDLEGTMTVESRPNVGTRVTIQLPLAATSEPPMPLVPRESSDA
jgi:signal transduction histidine kinase